MVRPWCKCSRLLIGCNAAWLDSLFFSAVSIMHQRVGVHGHCLFMHGWISFVLHMKNTHGEVMMHVQQIFDLMLHGLTLAVFQCWQPYALKSLCLWPLFGYACMDFIHFVYKHHALWGLDTQGVDCLLDAAWLDSGGFSVLPAFCIKEFLSTAKARLCMDGFHSFYKWSLPMVRPWCTCSRSLIWCCMAGLWLFFSAASLVH